MSELEGLKKEMLRRAVAENVTHVREPRPKPSGKAAWLRRTVRLAALVFVPMAVFLSVNVFSTGNSAPEVLVVNTPEKRAQPVGFRAPRAIEPNVFHLQIKKVVLDPGHGGNDPGSMAEGLTEKEITLDVAVKLKKLLEADGLEVVMTRGTDRYLTLKDRAAIANSNGGDLFVAIHVNSIPVAAERGVETYCAGEAESPLIEQLAGAENRESGYSLADFRKLLEGVYAGVRQNESRQLAEAVQRNLFHSLRKVNPRLEDRGVKTAPFVVLVATEMPGILAEVSCLSSEEDARLLKQEDYRLKIASALHQGIRAYGSSRVLEQKATSADRSEKRGS